jgi:hypothetical protein
MATKQISFNKSFLDVIRSLTPLQPSMKFTRDSNIVSVLMASTSKSIAFKLDAPAAFFDFEGTEINFRDYSEFHQFINAFESIALTQTENSMVISNQNSEINYVMTKVAAMPKSPTGIARKDPNVTFILSVKDLAEIAKMSSLVKAEFIEIKFNKTSNQISIKIFNSAHDNSFKKTYTPEKIAEGTDNFDFIIRSEVISRMPDYSDYRISLVNTGFIFLEWKKDEIDFFAVSGRVRKTESSEA